jgi:hypothetical protein
VIIEGSCHCRNIRFALEWEPDPEVIAARACDCTFCVKHGGLWTSNPHAALRIRVADPAHVSKYRFGTSTADFHVCNRCGVAPVVTSEIEGRLYAVVSVRAFDNVDRARIREAPISFGDEEAGDRLARRRRHWIPDVAFVPEAVRA